MNENEFRERFGRDAELPPDPSRCATALVQAQLLTSFQARQLLAGRFRGLILGPYKILAPIGKGGMGTVYLAEHTELDRHVALKLLPPEKSKDKTTVERFKREARAAAALNHPGIVKVFDVVHSVGIHFMVMEYVPGKDLQSVLEEGGALHFATAISYALQAAAGLQHAHEKGIVHRDIKPANLILAKDGAVKILDMGLARSFQKENDKLTEALDKGAVLGTADFISPEQAIGDPQDERSDIYSLGATLYSLITGLPPFKGHTTQVLLQHQMAEPPRLSKRLKSAVPPGLDDAIRKMMAKKKNDRFQSMEEVIEALTPFVSGAPAGAAPAGAAPATGRKGFTPDRRRLAAIAGVAALVVGLGIWALIPGSPKSPSGGTGPVAAGPAPGVTPAAASAAPSAAPAAKEPGIRRVKMDRYEAGISDDGAMRSFRVNDVEFLKAGVSISRGLYMWQNWNVPDLEVAQPSDRLVTAKGGLGTIRYEFEPDRLNVIVANTSSGPLTVFMVFDTADVVLADGAGEWRRLPADIQKANTTEPRWARTTWYSAGKAKVTLQGAAAVWGPWEETCEVAELVIPVGATRTLVFEAGTPSAEEAAKAAAAGKQAQSLLLDGPKDYQVYQRQSRTAGKIAVRGRLGVTADRVEARVTGAGPGGPLPGGWEPVAYDATAGTFTAELPAPAGGWYAVDVRAVEGNRPVAETAVGHVGVGEVFVIAGQSNSTNCGEEKLKQASGMVSTFGGRDWRLADDPQPGVQDNSAGGSPWPAFGDALHARYHVPIGIASTGFSGTSVTQWEPNGNLFRKTTQRMLQLNHQGFRAVLWHQGEADVSMEAGEYARRLTDLIRASRQTAGWDVPWFVARVSYHSPTSPSHPSTREGQKRVWDSGVALAGPDTDELGGDNRENKGTGIHFSGKGLRAHGAAWAEKVGDYLDKVLTN